VPHGPGPVGLGRAFASGARLRAARSRSIESRKMPLRRVGRRAKMPDMTMAHKLYCTVTGAAACSQQTPSYAATGGGGGRLRVGDGCGRRSAGIGRRGGGCVERCFQVDK
jgi:hypothetical protein